ncbi:MAG: CBS domain-containing protein [Elusimicrobia bacterium]|nr:CBS domain-containing protein [Elusimicrobiota bacterium]
MTQSPSEMTLVDPFLRPLSELSGDPWLALPEATPYSEAVERMRESRAGSLVVVKDGRPAGVFTERDVLNKCLLEGLAPATPLSSLMTPAPVTLPATATVREAIALMHAKRIRNIPLVDAAGAPKGLLTVGRLIRFLAYAFPAEVVNLPPRPGQVTEEVEGA